MAKESPEALIKQLQARNKGFAVFDPAPKKRKMKPTKFSKTGPFKENAKYIKKGSK